LIDVVDLYVRLFVNISSDRHYLWRAVDQDGYVVDIDPRSGSFLQKQMLASN